MDRTGPPSTDVNVGRTLGFALAKELIRGLTRCHNPSSYDLNVLPIFGCIQRSPCVPAARRVVSLDLWRWV